MSLRIAHISDTHLGFADLDRVSSSGINQREEDVYRVWQEAVDRVIELAPDALVHTGDFFHRPCPTNRALIEALTGLKRLSEAGIPVVMIAGNHSTPRTVYTSPILKSLESIDGVFPVFRETYERVTIGGAVFHAVPHVNDETRAREELLKVKPTPEKINVLMLHTSMGADFLMEEFGERVFPKDLMPLLSEFDYTALGHFHTARSVGKSGAVWYAGSTERLSEKDAGKDKGFLLVTIEEAGAPAVEFIPLRTRPWLVVRVSSSADKTIEAIRAELVEHARTRDLQEAIVTVHLDDLTPVQSIDFTNPSISALFPGALTVETRRSFREERYTIEHGELRKESLLDLFASYARENTEDDSASAALIQTAKRYFQAREQREHEPGGSAS